MDPIAPAPPVSALPGSQAVKAAGTMLRMTAERERLKDALQEIVTATGATGARIWWRIRSEFPLTLWASYNSSSVDRDPVYGSAGPWAPVWEGRVKVVHAAASEMPERTLPPLTPETPVDVWALIPSGTRARGAAVIWWEREREEIPEVDREFLRAALSAFAAQVWWRERWAQRKLERELLDETARLFGRSLDRQEVLNKILDVVARVVRYDAGGIFLIDQDAGEVEQVTVRGYDAAFQKDLRLKIGHGLVGYVAQTGEIVNVPDVSKDNRYINARLETRSALVVPLEMRGRRLGVLILESNRKNAYDPNDEWLVQAFAYQVAVTLDRAELFDQLVADRKIREQLAVARSIQESFLPQRAPVIAGYDVGGVNFPSEQVGGDYFDFIPIVDGQWGIAIADVSGKGIPAALIMAGFRASLIAEIRNNYAIRTIFRKVNNLLREMTAHDNFVTAFYGVLDAKNRVFTFSNGGHNPPILIRANGEIIRLREGGPLVGVIQDAVYEERPVWLMPGDLVTFFTDGVTEAQKPNGEEYGEQRLIDLVSAHRDETAAQLCARIHEAVLDFVVPGPQTDDITLILIKVAS